MGSGFILILVIVAAPAFDFTNGFHDMADAVATSIAPGALKPRVAVMVSAVLNFVGAFISISVAATIAKGIVNPMFSRVAPVWRWCWPLSSARCCGTWWSNLAWVPSDLRLRLVRTPVRGRPEDRVPSWLERAAVQPQEQDRLSNDEHADEGLGARRGAEGG